MVNLALWQAAVTGMHGGEGRLILLLSAARELMYDAVRHLVPPCCRVLPERLRKKPAPYTIADERAGSVAKARTRALPAIGRQPGEGERSRSQFPIRAR